MSRRTLPAAALACSLVLASCASSSRKADPALGTRVLACVVVDREHDSGGNYRGTGNYYLVFEAREGQATSRYRLEVTQRQWQRFHEGDRVKITLNNNILVDIRSNE
jgi:hypothetical protein